MNLWEKHTNFRSTRSDMQSSSAPASEQCHSLKSQPEVVTLFYIVPKVNSSPFVCVCVPHDKTCIIRFKHPIAHVWYKCFTPSSALLYKLCTSFNSPCLYDLCTEVMSYVLYTVSNGYALISNSSAAASNSAWASCLCYLATVISLA